MALILSMIGVEIFWHKWDRGTEKCKKKDILIDYDF